MFLKSLKISAKNKTIREIIFRRGINLIVDETPVADDKSTGNNVGKTTILKLIDFCLGADPKVVYVDPESKRDVYVLVKDFLIDNEVLITLILKENLEEKSSHEIIIEKNFLFRKDKIQKINHENLTEDEFEIKLLQSIVRRNDAEKPTFRQIISHNIRYKDESIGSTLRTLDKYTTDAEYESLYLFLFGCEFTGGNFKQGILEKIRQEDIYKKRLEKQQTKTAYETALALINSEIEESNRKKARFNLNEDFEFDLDKLNKIKYEINKISSEITKTTIRRDLIIEAEQELNSRKSDIDLQQLKLIYSQATNKVKDIQKTFDEFEKLTGRKYKFIEPSCYYCGCIGHKKRASVI